MRILICEDNPIVAMDLGWMLQDLGHRVCGTASTSIKGMEQFALKQPDLVVVDLELADGRTGLGLVEALAELRVPTIIVTGETQAVPGGTSARAVVGKPLDGDLLARALAAVETEHEPPASAGPALDGTVSGEAVMRQPDLAPPRRSWLRWLWRQDA